MKVNKLTPAQRAASEIAENMRMASQSLDHWLQPRWGMSINEMAKIIEVHMSRKKRD